MQKVPAAVEAALWPLAQHFIAMTDLLSTRVVSEYVASEDSRLPYEEYADWMTFCSEVVYAVGRHWDRWTTEDYYGKTEAIAAALLPYGFTELPSIPEIDKIVGATVDAYCSHTAGVPDKTLMEDPKNATLRVSYQRLAAKMQQDFEREITGSAMKWREEIVQAAAESKDQPRPRSLLTGEKRLRDGRTPNIEETEKSDG